MSSSLFVLELGPIKACDTIVMSKDIKSRKWTLKAHFSGLPKREDLEIVEEQVPELKDGGTIM